MEEKTKTPKEVIKDYLDERSNSDELFAKAYAKENKNIDECFDFILGEARKRGTQVCMSDEEVFGLAVHYYDEDNIEVSKIPSGTRVQAKASVKLTEEEKEQARQQAIQDYKQQCVAKLEAAEKAKAQKAAERKKNEMEKRRHAESLIPSLF